MVVASTINNWHPVSRGEGHEIITLSRDYIEAQGYRVIYGDTDSLFVLPGSDHDSHSSQQIGQRLMDELNNWWKKNTGRGTQN